MCICILQVQNNKCQHSKNTCQLVPVKEDPEDKTKGSTVNDKQPQGKNTWSRVNDRKKGSILYS